MLLVGVQEDSGWLLSRWNLTYRVGWEHICTTEFIWHTIRNIKWEFIDTSTIQCCPYTVRATY